MKQCSICGQLKPESEFYKNRSSSDGLQSQCKECHKQKQACFRDKRRKQVEEYEATHEVTYRKEMRKYAAYRQMFRQELKELYED